MRKLRIVRGVPVEEGSGNVYADLGYTESESMLVKAQLAARISEIIRRRGLTQGWCCRGPWFDPAENFRPFEGPVPRYFGTPSIGMPHAARTGCTYCYQACTSESEERSVDNFRCVALALVTLGLLKNRSTARLRERLSTIRTRLGDYGMAFWIAARCAFSPRCSLCGRAVVL